MMEVQKYKLIFEILHYKAVEASIKTIESIINNIDTQEYLIVVVDNCSPDDSVKVLNEKYGCNNNIEIICNCENSGFTRGLNYGVEHIRTHYEFEFLILMNNDVCVLDTMFYQKTRKYMDKYRFAVAGPNVVDIYGRMCNPVAFELPSRQLISERMNGPKRALEYDKVGLMGLYTFLHNSWFDFISSIGKRAKVERTFVPATDVVLHGCFWIFSNKYFEAYAGLADKEFMYGEEETLQLCVKKAKLLSLYIPDISVVHLCRQSSNVADINNTERLRRTLYNRHNTWKEYLDLYNKLYPNE